ncbi:MAG: hypothetical protein JWN93_246 [Hyphomicrobiales bacterium]|nr:hypothetical protein [Hyphomicrobiales bacterium]
MADTTNLALPFMEAAQAQKHVTHNEALAALDVCVQLSVLARDVAAPPASLVAGARYIVAAAGSGAFAGKAGQVASWDAAGWRFMAPRAGWLAYVAAEDALVVHDGAAWVRADGKITLLQNVSRLGVGTNADAGNPLSAKLNAALFAARPGAEGGDGDLRFKLNKEATAKTVSQLYQSNWSGRAETGLMGDDRFRIKVSADGAAWLDAMEVDPATGAVAFRSGSAAAPGVRFLADGGSGIANPANGVVALVAAGAERARASSAGLSADVMSGNAFRLGASAVVTDAANARVLGAADNGKLLYFTAATPIVVTAPADLGAGFSCAILQGGAGQVTLAAGAGASVSSYQNATKTAGVNAMASVVAPVANGFVLAGAITS